VPAPTAEPRSHRMFSTLVGSKNCNRDCCDSWDEPIGVARTIPANQKAETGPFSAGHLNPIKGDR
jgi:hypothetical protein